MLTCYQDICNSVSAFPTSGTWLATAMTTSRLQKKVDYFNPFMPMSTSKKLSSGSVIPLTITLELKIILENI